MMRIIVGLVLVSFAAGAAAQAPIAQGDTQSEADPWVKETMQELQRLSKEEWTPNCTKLAEQGQVASVEQCVKLSAELWYYKRLSALYAKQRLPQDGSANKSQ
jgi:hypothetical protein